MNIDKAREYVVIVNGGSGCILQPMSDEYTYVLTAKHNVEKNANTLKEIIQFLYDETIGWTENVILLEHFEQGQNYFPHPDKDIAIVKLPLLEGYNESFRFDHIDDEKTDFSLMGYPKQRRDGNQDNKAEWYRRDGNVTIKDPRESGLYEATVPTNPTLEEIKGQSGGCLCKIYKNKLFIAGIQNRMADEKEHLGNVRFTAIRNFDEIVAAYPEQLAPIFPSHLQSFKFLQNEAFNLNAGIFDENIRFVKLFLRNKIKEVLQSPITPHAIRKLFESRLLLFNESPNALHSKSTWIIWLEFLTILNLLKVQHYTEDRVKEIFNEIRLLCSDSDKDWCWELTNMIYADYKGLPKNGIVIIGISTPPFDESYILDRKIPLIDKAILDKKGMVDSNLLKIDDGINFPLHDYRFFHIDYFKAHCISKKHKEFVDLKDDDEKILAKLKEEYKDLVDNG